MISIQSLVSLGTYTFPLYSTRPCSKAHSSDLIILVPDRLSSSTALTTAFSWSFDDLILLKSFSSCPSISRWPWHRAQTQKNSGLSRVTSLFSDSIPFLRSVRLNKTLAFAISDLALCSRWKSKDDKYKAHCAYHQFSFFADIKYSKFQWSVQISILCPQPSK